MDPLWNKRKNRNKIDIDLNTKEELLDRLHKLTLNKKNWANMDCKIKTELIKAWLNKLDINTTFEIGK